MSNPPEKPGFEIYHEGQSLPSISMLVKMVLVVRQFRNTLDQHLRRLGQSTARMEALAAIMNTREPSSQSDLAKRLRLENATITRMVDILSNEGLVERLPDPTDRRVNLLTIAPRGEQVLAEIFKVYDALREHTLAKVPAARYDEMAGLFDSMLTQLDEPLDLSGPVDRTLVGQEVRD